MHPVNKPVAMITGGNRGIGRGISRALLRAGWAVSIMATRDADAADLAGLTALGPVRYTRGDVANLADHRGFLDNTRAAWGRVDALINNAGVAPTHRLDVLEAEPESYDRVLSINLRGPYFLTQLVARAMIADRSDPKPEGTEVTGTIVNITSISAETVSTDRGEYCISKAGAAMASRVWAARLAPERIPVYELRPGVIATDMTAGVHAKYDAAFAAGLAPMPRWGRPADVGSVVVQLVSGRLPYSTGEVIHVDGGLHIARL